jgi:hypothetical protein
LLAKLPRRKIFVMFDTSHTSRPTHTPYRNLEPSPLNL